MKGHVPCVLCMSAPAADKARTTSCSVLMPCSNGYQLQHDACT